MGETCEVCGEACPLVDHWYMGGAPGEYEAAMAKHWGLGYERSQAALVAANARAEKAVAEIVNEQRRFGEMQREAWKLEEALAAARRECEGLRKALEPFARMADRKDGWPADSGCAHLPSMAQVRAARAALAAPAAGEEGKHG